jgi:hypothetical protein
VRFVALFTFALVTSCYPPPEEPTACQLPPGSSFLLEFTVDSGNCGPLDATVVTLPVLNDPLCDPEGPYVDNECVLRLDRFCGPAEQSATQTSEIPLEDGATGSMTIDIHDDLNSVYCYSTYTVHVTEQ